MSCRAHPVWSVCTPKRDGFSSTAQTNTCSGFGILTLIPRKTTSIKCHINHSNVFKISFIIQQHLGWYLNLKQWIDLRKYRKQRPPLFASLMSHNQMKSFAHIHRLTMCYSSGGFVSFYEYIYIKCNQYWPQFKCDFPQKHVLCC